MQFAYGKLRGYFIRQNSLSYSFAEKPDVPVWGYTGFLYDSGKDYKGAL
jgi:hypothetical protein